MGLKSIKSVSEWVSEWVSMLLNLINFLTYFRSQRARFEHTDMEVDRSIFELNVFSVINLTRVILPDMLNAKKGKLFQLYNTVSQKYTYMKKFFYQLVEHKNYRFFSVFSMHVVEQNKEPRVKLRMGSLCTYFIEHLAYNSSQHYV